MQSNNEISVGQVNNNKNIDLITILLLILIYPVGLIVMWFATTWKTVVKVVITIVPLVIIVILAILTTVVLISINPSEQIKKARDTRRKADIQVIQTTLKVYYVQEGEYPVV